jgi:hypothetical protein
MVPTLFFYQLVLVALVWLCVMLQWAWAQRPRHVSTAISASAPKAEAPP